LIKWIKAKTKLQRVIKRQLQCGTLNTSKRC